MTIAQIMHAGYDAAGVFHPVPHDPDSTHTHAVYTWISLDLSASDVRRLHGNYRRIRIPRVVVISSAR